MDDVRETLEWTTELVAEAARRAQHLVGGGPSVDLKADGSLVTNVDRTIEQFLREQIGARYPGHMILGEEYGWEERRDDVPLWALDPIDGTTNLAHGIPLWGVSVGLVVDDVPFVGVVAFPALGETYAAGRGLGATVNGAPLPALPAGGPTHWEDAYGVCSTSVREADFSRVPARLRALGSAALDVCWAAAGRLAGCQSIKTALYDVAAGICIANETGAVTRWLSGVPWSPLDMARTGPRPEVLLTAPAATLAFLRENLVR